MKYFLIFIPLILYSLQVFSEDIYSYKEYELKDSLTKEGSITFSDFIDKKQVINVDITGNVDFFFSMRNKFVSGFNIFDIKENGQVMGISIFTQLINKDEIKNLLNNSDKNSKIKSKVRSLDKNHPQFKDQAWVYTITYKGKENIKIMNNSLKTIHIYTEAWRPSGPGHCMFGNFGKIKIKSWYSLEDGKLLKQIFSKFNCSPLENRILSKEILTLTI